MHAITRQSEANIAARKFEQKYRHYYQENEWPAMDFGSTRRIHKALVTLGESPNPDAVDALMEGWTHPGTCCECNVYQTEFLLEIGEPLDYCSRTTKICKACIAKAYEVAFPK